MTYHTKYGSLGATDAEKQRRYGLMGMASVGVVLYYLSHKNYVVAGLYSAITAGYFASSADYRENKSPDAPRQLPSSTSGYFSTGDVSGPAIGPRGRGHLHKVPCCSGCAQGRGCQG
jgi:hypothetical protein